MDYILHVDRHLRKLEEPNPVSGRFAEIVLDSDLQCPLLTEEKLCGIHLNRGPEYLSNLCLTYPRVTNVVNDFYERSAALSCPEAARHALLDPEGLLLEETLDTIEEDRWHFSRISTGHTKPRYKYFQDLQAWVMKLIKNRAYSLTDRMLMLGLFCERLEKLYHSNRVEEIPRLIESFSLEINKSTLWDEISTLPSSIADRLQLLRKLIDMRLFAGCTHRQYLQYIMESLKGIHYTRENLTEEGMEAYRNAYRTYYEPFMLRNPHILENYLLNFIFKGLFPSQKNIYKEYFTITLQFALLQMQLVGLMSSLQDAFSEKHIIKLVYTSSRTFEHAPSQLKEMVKWLDEHAGVHMSTASLLLKDS
jgi:lysine-N-methylase